jgi:hypothetical protein
MQAESDEHKNFGQPVVSEDEQILDEDTRRLAYAGAGDSPVPDSRVPASQGLRRGRLEHLRVVNVLLLSPAAVVAFARAWRARQ